MLQNITVKGGKAHKGMLLASEKIQALITPVLETTIKVILNVRKSDKLEIS